MEDDLNFLKMKDDLNFLKIEDDLNLFENGMTQFFFQMEDNLKKIIQPNRVT